MNSKNSSRTAAKETKFIVSYHRLLVGTQTGLALSYSLENLSERLGRTFVLGMLVYTVGPMGDFGIQQIRFPARNPQHPERRRPGKPSKRSRADNCPFLLLFQGELIIVQEY
jgi:hypothetical protein